MVDRAVPIRPGTYLGIVLAEISQCVQNRYVPLFSCAGTLSGARKSCFGSNSLNGVKAFSTAQIHREPGSDQGPVTLSVERSL